ncbi:MAG: succinate dehydrogenase/fumarate reductase iron-sulfur subunit, partial [Propionibacteriaceae bacterium]|nr:succinate dehydrogenase/fumarate reductase iron-sulfur subunit [Propionibacteriaceae bacterium]
MNITLRVWRQANTQSAGKLESYDVAGVSTDMSFLEMLDQLNEELTLKGVDPVAFDHD